MRMSTFVRVLTDGYARRDAEGRITASSSAVLIVDSGKKILADPGANSGLILTALRKEALKPEEIDIVFLTHPHPDHFLSIRLFPRSAVCDGAFLYVHDEGIPLAGRIPETSIEVVPTPGHAPDHASLLVDAAEGCWAVAGDVFWWWDEEEQMTDAASLLTHPDEFAQDVALLRDSRLKLLRRADIFIPGHGRVFTPPLFPEAKESKRATGSDIADFT